MYHFIWWDILPIVMVVMLLLCFLRQFDSVVHDLRDDAQSCEVLSQLLCAVRVVQPFLNPTSLGDLLLQLKLSEEVKMAATQSPAFDCLRITQTNMDDIRTWFDAYDVSRTS